MVQTHKRCLIEICIKYFSNAFFSIPVVYNISGVAMNFLDAVKVIMELYDKQVTVCNSVLEPHNI
jgi:hypothetical protein